MAFLKLYKDKSIIGKNCTDTISDEKFFYFANKGKP
jgi:hypothetical protein